jgi:hypothetical protein
MRTRIYMSSLVALLAAVWVGRVDAQPKPDPASVKKVIGEICSDDGAWLRCYSLEPSRCQEITAGFVEPCVERVMATPVAEPATRTVTRLLVCFNQRFMAKYGHGEVKTPECKDPMKHLSRNG